MANITVAKLLIFPSKILKAMTSFRLTAIGLFLSLPFFLAFAERRGYLKTFLSENRFCS